MFLLQLALGLAIFTLCQPVAVAQESESNQVAAESSRPDSLFKPGEIGAAPISLLQDKARLFSEREASQLSARLKEFGAQHNILIYVTAYSVLIGETIDERAARLKDEWLGSKPGVVVVYQRGAERVTFSSLANPTKFVGRMELEEIFQEAYAAAAPLKRGSSRVIAATDKIMEMLPEAIEAQQLSSGATAADTRSFVGWALAGLVLAAASGMIGFQFLRRTQVKVTKTYAFPAIRADERFGAPYCGGHQAEIQFTTQA